MAKSWLILRRSFVLMALGGSMFGIFGPAAGGCDFALYKDYETLFQGVGEAAIQTVSDGVFGNFGDTFDNVIRAPSTTFAQSAWDNWVATRVPDDTSLLMVK
jgi:hypothetical protein